MTGGRGVRTVLVTGATGAVGPAVVRTLVARGMLVRAFVRNEPPVALLPESADVVRGDLRDDDSLDRALADVDAVVHLAALLHRRHVTPDLEPLYREVNVQATRRLVASAAARGARVVFTSTVTIYAPSGSVPLTECSPPRPETLYAATKYEAEDAVLAARDASGRPLGTVLRLAAVYGPGIKGNYLHLVNALARRRFLPIGSGTNRRALVYADDVGQAVALALERPEAAGRVYNVSDGADHRLADIIAAICRALPRHPPRIIVPVGLARGAVTLIENCCRVAGRTAPLDRAMLEKYQEDLVVSAARIHDELGFQPRIGADEGWRRTVEALYAAGQLPARPEPPLE